MFDVVAFSISAFVLSWVLTAIILKITKRLSIVDHPNARSSHAVPTPRGGGLSIVLVFLAASLIYLARENSGLVVGIFLLGSGLIATVGLVDDLVDLSAKIRVIIHFLAAFLVAGSGFFVFSGFDGGRTFEVALPLLVWVFAIVWSLNLFNFMDGIDGIAAVEAIFVSLAGAYFLKSSGANELVVLLLVLASSSLGFLMFNWAPASIFLGDVASGFLGFVLASIALLSSLEGYLSPAVWIILGGTFLIDATYTLVVRLVSGQRWLEPHRLHVYQKLAVRLGSHGKTTILYAVVNLLWLLPMATLAYFHPNLEWWLVAVALTPLVACGAYFRGGATSTGPR